MRQAIDKSVAPEVAPPDVIDHANVYEALFAVQRLELAARKNAVNGHLKNRYANLEGIIEEVRPHLNAHGLLVLHGFEGAENGALLVKTTLRHVASGTEITELLAIDTKGGDPHRVGSAVTYARRYSLVAMLNLPAEDDDGNRAQYGRPEARSGQAKPAPATSVEDRAARAVAWYAEHGVEVGALEEYLGSQRGQWGPRELERLNRERRDILTAYTPQ